MRDKFALVLTLFLTSTLAFGQQSAASLPTLKAGVQQDSSVVYYAGPGISVPGLLPAIAPIKSIHKCEPLDGVVTFSGAVDSEGFPRGMKSPRLDKTDLDLLALRIVSAERFRPGAHNGVPASIAVLLTISMQTCVQHIVMGLGSVSTQLTLRAQPVQELSVRSAPATANASQVEKEGPGVYLIGGNIRAPVLLKSVEAQYPDHGKERQISGTILIGIIVDSDGKPQNVHVVRELNPILDRIAVEAVKQYLFKPAMRDGKIPVPVEVNVEVNFHRY